MVLFTPSRAAQLIQAAVRGRQARTRTTIVRRRMPAGTMLVRTSNPRTIAGMGMSLRSYRRRLGYRKKYYSALRLRRRGSLTF